MSLKSQIKRLIVRSGARPHTILTGAFRGLRMELDLANSMQLWIGLYERETHPWISKFGRECSSAIDVGASQGELTLYLLKRTNARSIVAFEPNPEYQETFARNIRMNGLGWGDRLIHLKKAGSGTNGTTRIDSITLPSPIFIRIDVDGLEMDVLSGANGLLTTARVRLIVETHSAILEQQCRSFLNNLGYKTKIIKNAWWRRFIKDQRPIELNRWLVASNDPQSPV
jgi:hypothetical protein